MEKGFIFSINALALMLFTYMCNVFLQSLVHRTVEPYPEDQSSADGVMRAHFSKLHRLIMIHYKMIDDPLNFKIPVLLKKKKKNILSILPDVEPIALLLEIQGASHYIETITLNVLCVTTRCAYLSLTAFIVLSYIIYTFIYIFFLFFFIYFFVGEVHSHLSKTFKVSLWGNFGYFLDVL